MKSLYEILGLEKDATAEDVKKAYRKKAQKAHPDRKGGSEDAMREVNDAYAVLSDADKRAHYDKTGQNSAREPSIDEVAMQSLAKAFDDMLTEEAPRGNIVLHIERGIADAIKRCEVEIKKFERYLAKLNDKATTVTKKTSGGDTVDLWTNVVEKRRERYELALLAARMALSVNLRSKELLSEYEGTGEAPPPGREAAEALRADFFRSNWTGA
jgi:curved DNA-binding protein CbpA